jgi:uncharacterized integral membrane protein
MLGKIVKALILVPLCIVILGFAVANRHTITVSLDPFDSTQPAYSATMPLFVLIFVLIILGVIIGGVAAWLRQSKWRRAARVLDDENRRLRAELAELHHRSGDPARPPGTAPAETSLTLRTPLD